MLLTEHKKHYRTFRGGICICLAVTVLASSGCGTMANLENNAGPCPFVKMTGVGAPTVIYGGVKRDMDAGGPFYLDVPLSAVADTVTLPIVIREQIGEQRTADRARRTRRAKVRQIATQEGGR